MCGREYDGLPTCPATWPGRPANWCASCRAAAAAAEDAARQAAWDAPFDGSFPAPSAAEGEPPCPLEAHQVEAFADWLARGDRPAWSLEQVAWPSPN